MGESQTVQGRGLVRHVAGALSAWLEEKSIPREQRMTGGSPTTTTRWRLTDDGAMQFFGGQTASGEVVTETTAMTISGLYRAVDVLTNVFAMARWPVYRVLSGGALEEAVSHPLTRLLNRRANVDTSAFDFKKVMQYNALVHGNALAEIIRNPQGRAVALWQLHPPECELIRDGDGDIWVKVTPAEPLNVGGETLKERYVRYRDVIHIKGLSHNGVMGASLLAYARDSLGLTKAGENFASRFYKNDGTNGLVLEIPGNPDREVMEDNRAAVEKWRTGENQHRTLPLKGNMKISKLGTDPDKAQAVESRQFQLGEISRWTGVPPHLISDLSKATFSNIENLALQFAFFSMKPWFTRWVQEVDYKCLTDREQSLYRSDIPVDQIIPIDSKTRTENDAKDIEVGVRSPDDVRLGRGMNPRPDGLGDKYLAPLNKAPAEVAFAQQEGELAEQQGSDTDKGENGGETGGKGTSSPDPKDQPADAEDVDPVRTLSPVIVDAASRLADAELAARERAWWSTDKARYDDWVGSHLKRVQRAFDPICSVIDQRCAASVAETIAGTVVGQLTTRDGMDRTQTINQIAQAATQILEGLATETGETA